MDQRQVVDAARAAVKDFQFALTPPPPWIPNPQESETPAESRRRIAAEGTAELLRVVKLATCDELRKLLAELLAVAYDVQSVAGQVPAASQYEAMQRRLHEADRSLYVFRSTVTEGNARSQAPRSDAPETQRKGDRGKRDRNMMDKLMSRFLAKADRGDPYKSVRELAKEFGCCANTATRVINRNTRLKNWQAGKDRKTLEAVSLAPEELLSQHRELPPDEQAAQNELLEDPELMQAELEKLKAEISLLPPKKQPQYQQALEIIQQADLYKRPALIACTRRGLTDDRLHQVKPKSRLN